MGLGYTLAYRLGITPWESAAQGGQEQLDRLFDEVTKTAGKPGRALDLGCGRGLHLLSLAQRGWAVTGVDQISRALDGARTRLRDNGFDGTLVQGDVTALPPEVGTGYTLLLDVGCFHGLSPAERTAYGHEVGRVTAPGAQVLVLAFRPGGRGPMPRGADAGDITAALPGFTLVRDEAGVTTGLPRPMRARAPRFYLLTRDQV